MVISHVNAITKLTLPPRTPDHRSLQQQTCIPSLSPSTDPQNSKNKTDNSLVGPMPTASLTLSCRPSSCHLQPVFSSPGDQMVWPAHAHLSFQQNPDCMVQAHPTQPPDKGLDEIRTLRLGSLEAPGDHWLQRKRRRKRRRGGKSKLPQSGSLSPPPTSQLTSPRTTQSLSIVHANLPYKLSLKGRVLLLQCVWKPQAPASKRAPNSEKYHSALWF